MTGTKKKPVKVVTKPFLTGGIFDENTLKNALKFFGMLVLFIAVALLVSLMSGFGSRAVTIIFNAAIILMLLYICYTQGIKLGTDAVARGEILYQRKEKGAEMTENERKLSFHPAKGFVIGLLGTVPLLILAIVFAFMTRKQITYVGSLPSVATNMIHRSEIGDALTPVYTEPRPAEALDYLRIVVRGCLMPVFRMADTDNKDLMLTLERLTPLMLLCPCIAYGFGYLQGKKERTRVHTRIAENRRMRKRKENKEKRDRQKNAEPRTPEQLN